MKERPILFSAPMIRAILEGRKSQTRRIVKPQPSEEWHPEPVGWYSPTKVDRNGQAYPGEEVYGAADEDEGRICPYGVPGDRLWVRETWTSGYQDGSFGTIFRADDSFLQGKRRHEKGPHFHAKEIGPHILWRPSIFMPRWASRITLEITEVRVQRLQEISEEDAKAEGIQSWTYTDVDGDPRIDGRAYIEHGFHFSPDSLSSEQDGFDSAKKAFRALWDSINAARGFGWNANPWVWAISFRRLP